MKTILRMLGIFSGDDSDSTTPQQTITADQINPQGSYVYGHYDSNGKLFYVGKGIGKRAWSDKRHPLWHRYVEKHLNGNYTVKIIIDSMSDEDAETLEEAIIAEIGSTLVNWINFGRQTDFKAIEKFHKLRNANRELILKTKEIETSNPEQAILNYKKAIEAIKEYAFIEYEGGLVGQLIKEENIELGFNGDLMALDRLTMVLCKQGKGLEALEISNEYFATYKKDLSQKFAENILKRVKKFASTAN